MKAWASSEADVLCGYCGLLIKSGTRFGVLERDGMKRKMRCAACFKMLNPPADTGEVAGPVQVKAEGMQRLSAIAPLIEGFDAKMRQAGHDE